jgi:tetratricopeptide (TPR) repeat protein
MFSGRLPFRAESDRAMLTAIVTAAVQPVTAARPGLPLELERIIGLCLEKEPGKRYQRAADLRADLDRLNRAVARRTLTSAGTGLPGPGLAFYMRKYRRRILVGALAAVILAALLIPPVRDAVGGWIGLRSGTAATGLAVLPFVVTGGDDMDNAFAAGLVEHLTTKLDQVERFQKSLDIVPAAVARVFGSAGVEAVRKALKVDQAITGAIQFEENRIYLTVHLNDARNVRILKSVDLDVPRKDLGTLPERVAEAAVGLMNLTLSPDMRRALEEKSSCLPEATPFVLQARGYLQRYESPKNVDIAVELLRKVRELIDGRCVIALAALGDAYWYKYYHTQVKPYLDLAQEAAEEALRLNENMPEVYVTLGAIQRAKGKFDDSLRNLEKARELDPLNGAAFRELGATYEMKGWIGEAERAYQKAIELRPEVWSGYQYLGAFYYYRGQYDQAERQWKKITELTPDNLEGYTLLGGLYTRLGRNAEAVAMLRRSIEIEPTAKAYSNLGTVFFFDRKYGDAAEMYENSISLGSNQAVCWGNLGDAYRFVPGSEERSRRAYETAVRLTRETIALNPLSGSAHNSLARYLALLGKKSEALAEMAEAMKILPGGLDVLDTAVQVYELVGQRDKALEALGELVRAGAAKLAEVNPDLAELRKDPRYREIVEEKK